ncbi:MAG: VWA domain-containing protein [Cryomorphaceae bacterium]|jgi:Ca-activated chloride channel family protein|nr:VWA domain-containing protein [Cryomorphaceae bacterium]
MFNRWNLQFNHYEFLEPIWFWGLLVIPMVSILLFRLDRRRTGDWKINSTNPLLPPTKINILALFRSIFIQLPAAILALLIIAMAKPYSWQESEQKHEENKYGIDIIIALDVSMSMYATDFEPNRLEAAKEVATSFINGRNGDKIGLVQYAGEAFTSCPPTLDYPILIEQLNKADGIEMEPGTAIGTGLGTSVVQLRNNALKSKVIILLTDGSNNSGDISPEEAALLAKEKGICVYTIGIGSNGMASTPVMTPTGMIYQNMPVEIDEQTLTQIATTTGGMYFRAEDKKGLEDIYEEIELMEKRKITHKVVQADPPPTPHAFLNWAFVLFMLYMLIKTVLFLPQPHE